MYDTDQAPAQTYVNAVQTLLQPAELATVERGPAQPTVRAVDFAERATHLSTVSAAFTQTLAGQLVQAEATQRDFVESQLLTKALTDLEVGILLFEAAPDETEQETDVLTPTPGVDTVHVERRLSLPADLERHLNLLLATSAPAVSVVDRGGFFPVSVEVARSDLRFDIEDTLAVIPEQAAQSISAAFNGMAGLGLMEVTQAAAAVGLEMAALFGQAQPLLRIYQLIRDFVQRAYEALWALLGPQVARIVGDQVIGWFEAYREGDFIERKLNSFYGTQSIQDELLAFIHTNGSDADAYLATIEQLSGLRNTFRQRTALAQKLADNLRFIRLIPAGQLPLATIILAAGFVAIAGYVLLTGADCLDAAAYEQFDRIAGIRHIVTANLLNG